jgi:hypothetical protein
MKRVILNDAKEKIREVTDELCHDFLKEIAQTVRHKNLLIQQKKDEFLKLIEN